MELKKSKHLLITIFLVSIILFFTQAITIVKVHAGSKSSLSTAIGLQNAGRYSEAITEYYSIIENDSHNFEAYFNLAELIEIVLGDYYSSSLLYDMSVEIAKRRLLFSSSNDEALNKEDITLLISKAKVQRELLITEIYASIEGVAFPRYIMLKPGKNVSAEYNIDNGNQFEFHGIENNEYLVDISSTEKAEINGNDILMIYYNSNENIELRDEDKAERYKNFVINFPEHKLSFNAKRRNDELTKNLTGNNILNEE